MDIQSWYAAAADAVVTVHTAFVGFVLVGQLLILAGWLLRWKWVRNPWFRVVHLTCIAIVAAEAMSGVICPLTLWERDLRAASGQSLTDSPIGWFFNSILFFDMPAEFFWRIHIAFGAMVLTTFLLAPPRFGRWRPLTLIPGLGLTRMAPAPATPAPAAVDVAPAPPKTAVTAGGVM